MSDYHVIAQEQGDDYLLVTFDGITVMAFESREAAEDFSDALDEPGEFVIIDYDPAMGPIMVVV